MKLAKQILAVGLTAVLLAAALPSCTPTGTAELTIDPAARHQTLESFGISSAWWSQDVGGWTDKDANGVPVREAVMELLYGKSGLGLQVYRYNLGAGTGTGKKPANSMTRGAPGRALSGITARSTIPSMKTRFGA